MADEVKVEAPKTPELTPEQKAFLDSVKKCAEEVNTVLTKYGLQFVVTHKIIVDTDLKREDILHDIILRPIPKA
jgi:hypothetical protein